MAAAVPANRRVPSLSSGTPAASPSVRTAGAAASPAGAVAARYRPQLDRALKLLGLLTLTDLEIPIGDSAEIPVIEALLNKAEAGQPADDLPDMRHVIPTGPLPAQLANSLAPAMLNFANLQSLQRTVIEGQRQFRQMLAGGCLPVGGVEAAGGVQTSGAATDLANSEMAGGVKAMSYAAGPVARAQQQRQAAQELTDAEVKQGVDLLLGRKRRTSLGN